MKRVLIIDDTKNIRLMLTKCLELEGYHVTTAGDGKEAIELFKKENFDLAFLDIKLPEIRGTEVLRRIREMGIDTPVIIITAYGTVKNAVECTHMGAVAYVQKPFTAEKIKSVLSELNLCSKSENNSSEKRLKVIHHLIEQGLFSEAIRLVKKVFSENPSNADCYLLLAKAYDGVGNIQEAAKFYQAYEIFSSEN